MVCTDRPSPAAAPAPLFSLRFARAYAITARPYLFFVSGASGLVGLALVPAADLPTAWLVAAGLGLFLTYGLGQALTDVFQTDTDALSAPYRPLVRGEIGKRQVLGVSLFGLGLVALLLAVRNPWTVPVSAAGVAGLASYGALKRRWWAGPPCNALVIALLPLLGYLCGGASLRAALAEPSVRLAMGSVFASYTVFILLGYLKDVSADRATGYQTAAVRFGRKPTVLLSAVHWLAGAVGSAVLLGGLEAVPAPGCVAWLAGTGLLGAAHLRIWPTTRDDEAHPALVWVVIGYVAMLLGAAACLRPSLTLPGAMLLALLLPALRARPERSQL